MNDRAKQPGAAAVDERQSPVCGSDVIPPKRVSRDPSPLKWRRVRHRESGRLGTIDSAHTESHSNWNGNKVIPANAYVVWDDTEPSYGGWKRPEKVEAVEIELLSAPSITASVRVRRVLFRGHKEQVAGRMAQLGSAPHGTERYIEFDPQPMAYRRWRIVSVGPPLAADDVAEIPDQYPSAASLRRMARDAGYDA